MVLHSQRLREKPLKPWVIAKRDGAIIGAHCNCMAGLGEACTHIAALLFAIDATVRIRDSKTVTQEKAYWVLPPSMKSVEFKRVRDIDFTSASSAKRKFHDVLESATSTTSPNQTPKVQRQGTPGSNPKHERVPEVTEEEINSLFKKLSDSGSRAVVLSVVEPYCERFVPKADSENFPISLLELKDDKCVEMNYAELAEHCAKIEIECTDEQRNAVEAATRDQSNSKLWNVFRAGRITASKSKAVCRTDAGNPSQSLIKAVCYPSDVKFTNRATKWGCDHEKIARDQFLKAMSALHENVRIEDCGLFISKEKPFIGASPDGLITCDCCGTSTVEVKCPFCAKSDLSKCAYLEEENGIRKLNRSHDYFFQVQTQLGCSNLERAYFIVWTQQELHVEEILFGEYSWNTICEKGQHFFYSAILPELVGKFYSKLPATYARGVLTEKESPQKEVNVLYCYCREGEHGDMIACDNENCAIEWFHYQCVKIQTEPRGKWYCPDCRKLSKFRSGKKMN